MLRKLFRIPLQHSYYLIFCFIFSLVLVPVSAGQSPKKESVTKEKVVGKKDKLEVYRIVLLKDGESLEVMKHPTKHAIVVDRIPYDGRWIIPKSKKKRYGTLYWREVSWNGTQGWVVDRYLAFDPVATKSAHNDESCLSKNRGKHCRVSSALIRFPY